MIALQYANLVVRFLLELFVLASLGYWGFQSKGLLGKIGLGIGAPLLAAVVWASFGSPNASVPLVGWQHLLLELAVFGSGAIALYAAGHRTLAGIFTLALVINRVLMAVWNQ
jgi:hypothetical protein